MTAIPDFSGLALDPRASGSADAWHAKAEDAAGRHLNHLTWETPEKIGVKPLYSSADLAGLDFLDTVPGKPPYVRGPYPTMYVERPWTIRQYAGFSTAKDSNAFYRRNLAAGQKGPVGGLRSGHPPGL